MKLIQYKSFTNEDLCLFEIEHEMTNEEIEKALADGEAYVTKVEKENDMQDRNSFDVFEEYMNTQYDFVRTYIDHTSWSSIF